MGTKVTLTAADGFRLNAYRADPSGPLVRGGVVVIQEIFGVNHSIRTICDRLADAGYRAIAPQLFDRIEPNFESGYTTPEVNAARLLSGRIDWEKMMLDASAAVDALKREGPTAIMGFCLGGSVAYSAAVRFGGLAAAVCYYGGRIVREADKKPKCPVQMHFGEEDAHIPMSDVEVIRQKRPECEIYTYPGAGHAFANEDRESYDLRSAKISWQRSLALLSRVFASLKRPQGASVAAVPVSAQPSAKAVAAAKPKPRPKAKPKAKPKSRPKARKKPKAKPSAKKRAHSKAKAKPKRKRKSKPAPKRRSKTRRR